MYLMNLGIQGYNIPRQSRGLYSCLDRYVLIDITISVGRYHHYTISMAAYSFFDKKPSVNIDFCIEDKGGLLTIL